MISSSIGRFQARSVNRIHDREARVQNITIKSGKGKLFSEIALDAVVFCFEIQVAATIAKLLSRDHLWNARLTRSSNKKHACKVIEISRPGRADT